MPRAVLDTNVLVSGLITPTGAPAQLLRELRAGAFDLVTSPILLDELAHVLARERFRRYVTADEAAAYVALVRSEGTVVADPAPVGGSVAPDPDDEYLIRLARAASAVLVSGDAHLLALGDRLPVESPAVFLRELVS